MLPASALKEPKLTALQENYFAHMLFFPEHMPATTVLKAQELIIIDNHFGDPLFNTVLRARLSDQNAPAAIMSTASYFERETMPFTWIVSPSDTPKELDTFLEQHDIMHEATAAGMIATIAERGFDQDVLRVERVLDPEQLAQVAAIALQAHGDTPAQQTYWKHVQGVDLKVENYEQLYVAYRDEDPVGYARLTYYAGVAGIHEVIIARVADRDQVHQALVYELLMRAQADGFENAVAVCDQEEAERFAQYDFQTLGSFERFVSHSQL